MTEPTSATLTTHRPTPGPEEVCVPEATNTRQEVARLGRFQLSIITRRRGRTRDDVIRQSAPRSG
jgi:hypothetical protein